MSEEQPQSTPAPNDLVQEFIDKYDEQLDKARVSAEHTATAGWQTWYAGYRAQLHRDIGRMRDRLEEARNALDDNMLDEDVVRHVRDAMKELKDICARADYINSAVLDPIVAPARRCEKLIDEYASKAIARKDRQPLVEADVVRRMNEAAAGVETVTFSEPTGIVSINPPARQQAGRQAEQEAGAA